MKCDHKRQTKDVVDAYVCDDCGATTVTILRAKLAAAEARWARAEAMLLRVCDAYGDAMDSHADDGYSGADVQAGKVEDEARALLALAARDGEELGEKFSPTTIHDDVGSCLQSPCPMHDDADDPCDDKTAQTVEKP